MYNVADLLDALDHCDILTIQIQSDRCVPGKTHACDSRFIAVSGTPEGNAIIDKMKEVVRSIEES